MPVVARLDQYASLIASEFDEINGNDISVSGVGTFYSSEFSENVGIVTVLTANIFPPYDLVYDEFASSMYGLGIGTFMRYNIDKSVTIYNEIDEVTTII
jgi:hypothetical protein